MPYKNKEDHKKNAAYRRGENRAKSVKFLGGKCVDCGRTDELQFDHKDPTTKITNIARLLTSSWDKIKIELVKCQLLCYDCHHNKTIESKDKQHKLTFAEADGIRIKYQTSKYTHQELAIIYKVSKSTIAKILRNEHYVRK